MRIVWIGDMLGNKQVKRACEKLGLEAAFYASRSDIPSLVADIAVVSTDHGDQGLFTKQKALTKVRVVAALGVESLASGVSTLSQGDSACINAYFAYGGEQNVQNGLRLLMRLAGGDAGEPAAPEETFFDAIYTPQGRLYRTLPDFFNNEGRRYERYVGMLSYRTRYVEGNMQAEDALADALEARGIGVIRAYSTGSPDDELGCLTFEAALEALFYETEGLAIEALVNFQFFSVRGAEGESLFDRAAPLFAAMGVPVIKPIVSSRLTEEEWEASLQPLGSDVALHYHIPEMQGIIEPMWIGCADGPRTTAALPERVNRLAGRIVKWVGLRTKANADKKIAIMLNSSVCSGVEATIGQASELDAFESVARVLMQLKDEGYAVEDAPETGEALRKLILQKKAHADFRWTSVSDIIASGGALYHMDGAEYQAFYATLTEKARAEMVKSWGDPPGESMVADGKLVITGICFGNIAVMVQPKRGCYGSKCTGEVCKLLQDPGCPPSHQYLATYHYIRTNFAADACIHVGTHGSLEFLPGKGSGLGPSCFSDIAIGDLPNLYLYNADCASEAITAKRRGYAVTIGHLPAPEGRDFAGYRHVFGRAPDERAVKRYIMNIWEGEAQDAAEIAPLEGLLAAALESPGMPGNPVGEDAVLLSDALAAAGNELESLIDGLAGRYIPAGAGAGASRESLPTGRNIHGLESDKLPSREAYAKGQEAAEAIIAKYQEETGAFPEKIAMTLSALDVSRTKGEQAAQFMALIGVEPVWNAKGRVTDLAAIEPKRLGRARVDVTAQISSIMRDAWPDIVDLLDRAIALAADQDEPEDINPVRKNAGTAGTSRIFGVAPGTYGNSIGLALKASAWKDESDLARYFLDSNAYAYGGSKQGEKQVEKLVENIRQTDMMCDVSVEGRTDGVSSSYHARMQGGFGLAARHVGSKRKLRQYIATSAPGGFEVSTFSEHMEKTIENTLLDEKWREQMMAQGYLGAADVMSRLQSVFETQCVLDNIKSQTLDNVARQCLFDEKMKAWFEKENPYALEEGARRFLELHQRGKWDADAEVLEQLREDYLKAEGDLEAGLGQDADVQGGQVEIITDAGVASWSARLADTDRRLGKMPG